MEDRCFDFRVDSSGITWPSSLIVNSDPAGVVSGGLLVGDRDKDPSMLERLSLSGSLLLEEGVLVPATTYLSVSWRTMKFR